MAELSFRMIDAFAEQPFAGNSAGVVLEADGLTDAQMQLIAREVNVSETAFVSRMSDLHKPPRLRWFTPSVEVGFCGHATLAAAHALHELGLSRGTLARPPGTLEFDSPAGTLRLSVEPDAAGGALWWLQMPPAGLRPEKSNPMKLCDLLGLTMDELAPAPAIQRTRDDDLIVPICSWQRLMDLRPRMAELAEHCTKLGVRGCLVTTTQTLSPAIQVHSRFFAPAAGVNEDPVTGSVHGPLALALVQAGLFEQAVVVRRAGSFDQAGVSGSTGGVEQTGVSTPKGGERGAPLEQAGASESTGGIEQRGSLEQAGVSESTGGVEQTGVSGRTGNSVEQACLSGRAVERIALHCMQGVAGGRVGIVRVLLDRPADQSGPPRGVSPDSQDSGRAAATSACEGQTTRAGASAGSAPSACEGHTNRAGTSAGSAPSACEGHTNRAGSSAGSAAPAFYPADAAWRIQIGGYCHTTIRGTIAIPAV